MAVGTRAGTHERENFLTASVLYRMCSPSYVYRSAGSLLLLAVHAPRSGRPARMDTAAPFSSPTEAPPTDTSRGAGERHALILVVERDPHVRELEAYFLNEAGYRVEFAGDGAAALELALEGLHLHRRLAKDEVDGTTVYGG